MTPTDEPDIPRTRLEVRTERLGFALRDLAAELVDERRKVAQLRQQVADLQAQLRALKQTQRADPSGPDVTATAIRRRRPARPT